MLKKLIHLDDFFMTRLSIEWIMESQTIDLPEENPCIDYDIKRNPDNKQQFALVLSLQAYSPKKQKCFLKIDSQIYGIFTFTKKATEEEMQHLIRLNGLIILYGLLRGQITTITGSFLGGRFMIPSIYMEYVISRVEGRKKAMSDQITPSPKTSKRKSRTISQKSAPNKKPKSSKV